MTFTVNAWLDLTFKGEGKPSLSMMVVYEGRKRPADCLWSKVVEADDWRKAYAIAIDLIRAGDVGDPIDSIPICPPKQRAEVVIKEKIEKKTQKKDAA